MNKHMEPILKLKKNELEDKALALRSDIEEARRSVYAGEAQNHQMIRAKRKELARVMTTLPTAAAATPKKKETK